MSMNRTYAGCKFHVNTKLHVAAFKGVSDAGIVCYMARNPAIIGLERPPHFFKQWRKWRNLTQEQLVSRLIELAGPGIPTTTASLSRLENGKQPYNQYVLEALAQVLGTDAGSLIMRNPLDPDAIWSIWDRANIGERQQIVKVAEALVPFKAEANKRR